MMSLTICKSILITCALAFISSKVVSADENCTSIADIVCESDVHTTLCDLVTASDTIVDTLTNSRSSLTLFAPTDDAFAALDADLLGELGNCTEAMDSVLAFHVVVGGFDSTDLECGAELAMANNDNSRTICKGDAVYQKGSQNTREDMPRIVAADIEACTGVVHVVDQVMLPMARRIPFDNCYDSADVVVDVDPPAPPASGECQTIAEIVCGDPYLSTLCDLVTEFELAEAFSSGTWTLFAPVDAAFAGIEDVAQDLTPKQIEDVLRFHAVPNVALAYDALPCKELTAMANGKNSRTKCDRDDATGDRIKYQRGSGQMDGMMPRIALADVAACNGIVHIVNNVLIPKL